LYETATGHLVSVTADIESERSAFEIEIFNADMTRVVNAGTSSCRCPEHKIHMQLALKEYLQSEELQLICEKFDKLAQPYQLNK
jgi:hypothetical protein